MEVINKRRSVRQFSDKKVESEKILSIIKSGMQAPSAKNQQPWEFAVVEDRKNIEKLSLSTPYTKFSINATTIVVVYMRKKGLKAEDFVQQDMGACIENMLLESTNQGLGSTWMGIYPNKERYKYIKELFNLSEDLIPFSLIAFGYPKDDNSNRFVDRFDETRIHYIEKEG